MCKVWLCYNLTCERIIDALESDSELNIGNNLRWPCSICNKNVTQRMKGIKCDTCDKWSHIKCNGLSSEEYDYFIKTDDVGSSRLIGIVCIALSNLIKKILHLLLLTTQRLL